jgi:hypothetical protein
LAAALASDGGSDDADGTAEGIDGIDVIGGAAPVSCGVGADCDGVGVAELTLCVGAAVCRRITMASAKAQPRMIANAMRRLSFIGRSRDLCAFIPHATRRT